MADLHLKALVFDAYGTLFNPFALQEKLTEAFGEKAGIINQIWRQKQLEYTWLRALMERYVPFQRITWEALRYACQSVDIIPNDEDFQEIMEQYLYLPAYDEVPVILKQLKGIVPLCILSNANPAMLESAIAANRLEGVFDHVFSAHSISTYKPRPEIYQLACDGLNLPAEHIGFISGNPWDVAGAASFGLQVLWLNRGKKQAEELGVRPRRQLDSLEELLPIVKRSQVRGER
ncbi:MAG: haloacid dehalogenase type II [Bacteroidota bacterium]